MISITDAQLDAWLAAFFFPLARVFGLMATAPVFNNASLPVRVKLIAGLDMLRSKREELPKRKHGNVPL
mgnify:CR=1 FL=1